MNTEYKVKNGVFSKRKAQLMVQGDQQEEGDYFKKGGMYAPVLKGAEVLLMHARQVSL
jgi:hypothetical protein